MSGQKLFTSFCLAVTTFCSLQVNQVSGQTGLSSQDRQELLNAHNHFRSIVDPPASNMKTMRWSNDLEKIAQQYASRCTFSHNGDRSSGTSFSYVGENLYITSSQNVNYTSLVRGWFDERDDYDYRSGRCSGVCGHYTQVVWADSNSLGCGAYRCARTIGFSYPNSLILVCNYGPGGNFRGQKPYESAKELKRRLLTKRKQFRK